MDARPRFTFALFLASVLGAAVNGAAFVLAGLPVVLVLIVVVGADFAGTKGCATAVIGFSVGLAGVLVASAFSLIVFCVLSGIGLSAGPAALAIVAGVPIVQRET
ncbi:MAG: hypothetical protein Q8T09_09820 [Candidatus Melainabacteria bacterium]|nr:hypothetical protein [Candidatus Melainabacteria bacterium]